MGTPVSATSVAIVTLGCGRNEVDSDQLAGLLLREGRQVVDDPAVADVVLVNTCTFIAPAKQESIDTVLEACQLKDDGDTRAVVVVGCMAQRYPHELAEAIPEADAIVGFDGYAQLPTILDAVLAGPLHDRVVGVGVAHPGSRSQPDSGSSRPLVGGLLPVVVAPVVADDATIDGAAGYDTPASVSPAKPGGSTTTADDDSLDRIPPSGPRFPIRRHDGRPWAYLKIASGCDRVCTFCAIPSFRGRFRSRPVDELVAEAKYLADNGARELVLVSENTTSWGKDLPGGRDLVVTLLEQLGDIHGLERLRLMYLQPAELTERLVDAMIEHPKVANYFDLSLQHVAADVVARMARSGDHERFAALMTRIRQSAPDAVFRSNFILGFPGETDDDVALLERFLIEQRLDWVGLFPFSPEDGTPAYDLDDQLPEEVGLERVRRVSELQERLADDRARSFVGRRLDVIVQESLDGVTTARSYREAPDTDGDIEVRGLHAEPVSLPAGRVVTVEVVANHGVDLVARLVDVPASARSSGNSDA